MKKLPLLYLLYYLSRHKRKRKKIRVGKKELMGSRINVGFYEELVQELRFEDESEYKNLLSMTLHNFDEILGLIENDITKKTQI